MAINDKSSAIFDPDKSPHVHIIGGGAMGSKVAELLGRMGLDKITVYDFDKVEEHNIGNQGFHISDIGAPKAEAVKALVNNTSGMIIKAVNEKVTPDMMQKMRGFIFLTVDSMEGRKILTQATIDGIDEMLDPESIKTRLLDSRIALNEASIFYLDPTDEYSIDNYKKTLCSTEDIKEEMRSACGRVQGLGSLSHIAAGLMCNLFIQSQAGRELPDETLLNVAGKISSIEFNPTKKQKENAARKGTA